MMAVAIGSVASPLVVGVVARYGSKQACEELGIPVESDGQPGTNAGGDLGGGPGATVAPGSHSQVGLGSEAAVGNRTAPELVGPPLDAGQSEGEGGVAEDAAGEGGAGGSGSGSDRGRGLRSSPGALAGTSDQAASLRLFAASSHVGDYDALVGSAAQLSSIQLREMALMSEANGDWRPARVRAVNPEDTKLAAERSLAEFRAQVRTAARPASALRRVAPSV